MAETESQKVQRGVEEGFPKRDYKIEIPEEGYDDLEAFLNVDSDIPTDKVPEQPYERPARVSNATKNGLAVEAAAIEESITGSDHFQLLQKALNTMDPKAQLGQMASHKVQADKQQAEDAYVNHNFTSPEEMGAQGVVTVEKMKEAEKQLMNPHLAYVKAIAKQEGPEVARIANKLKLKEMIDEITDEMDWTDYTTSFLGLLVPGNTLKDAHDISGSMFDGDTFMRNLVLNYKKASPEDQAELLGVIKEELFDKLDNPIKVKTVLTAMLAPGGEETGLELFDDIWAGLEVAEIASLGAGTALKIAELGKTLNAIRVAKEVGNTERASKLTSSAVVDAKMGETLGLDRIETANLAGPFNMSKIDAAYVEGLHTQTIDDINIFMKQADNLQHELQGSNYFLREGLLDPLDRAKVEKSFLDELGESNSIENVEVVSRTGSSTTFRLNKGGKSTEHTLDLTLDDVGAYENKVTTLMDDFVFSPAVTGNKPILKQAIAAAQRQDMATARVYNALVGFQREAVRTILGPLGMKGLTPGGRRRLAELDHVLKVGDARREVYTARELAAGVDGVKLNEKQIEAYFKVRKLVDVMHQARNHEMRNEMVIRGQKNIRITDDMAEIGKPFEDFQSAVVSLAKNPVDEIFDVAQMKPVPFNKLRLEEEYESGRQLVKLRDASSFQTGDARWRYALVDPDDISDLPMNVINYRTGYIPKINLNANYFVKSFSASKIDGIEHAADSTKATISTERVFDNRADAERFAEQLTAERGGRGVQFRVLEDRQLEKEARALGAGFDEAHSLGGSLYTGARKDEQLLFGFEGKPLETLGSFEAIGRNLSNLSRFIPRNEWRMGLEQKAINTAHNILPESQKVQNFADLAHLPDTQQGRYLKWLHRQIEDWMGFPSKEEQLWQNMNQWLYEGALKSHLPKGAAKGFQYIKQKDPIAAARAGAFHSLLGWFNPIQLWVQAQGAAVALSANILNPARLGVVLKDGMALAAARYTQNPESLRHVAKSFGMKADELEEMHSLWMKSGIEDSILMTADHAAAVTGRSIGMDAFSRGANAGLFFYRKGEMFNRRSAFVTSYREWKAKNPNKVVGDEELKAIMQRTNDFLLNLGKANRAGFQKGIWGLPTQFLQVSTKTLETLFGLNKNFTKAERGKLFLSQLLLYGAAGTGINSLGSSVASGLLGYTDQASIENDMTPEQRKLINEGFLGWATLAAFGADIEIGQRSSLLSGVSEFTDRLLFDDTEFSELVLGAFGSTANRFWDGMTSTLKPVMYGQASVMDIDYFKATSRLLSTISTWSNVQKAMYMHNLNLLTTRKGGVLRRRDFTAMEEIANAIGFRLSEENQIYELETILRDKQEFDSQVANDIVNIMNQFALKHMDGTISDEDIKETEEQIAMLYQIMPTQQERLDLRDMVKNKLTSGKGDRFTQAWRKFYKEFNDGRVGDLYGMHSRLSTYGIQQKIKSGDEQ